jgi:hypothetical protein
MLIALTSSLTVIPHGTAAGTGANTPSPWFAREESYLGGSIDTNYASGDRVAYWDCKPGDQVYALLEASANVAAGVLLESNGAGALQALSSGAPVARTLEAVNNSGGGTPVRIRVEVL